MYPVLNLKGKYLQLDVQKILSVMLLSVTALLTCMSVSLCKLVSHVRGGEYLIKHISKWNTLTINQLNKDLHSLLNLIEDINQIRKIIKSFISKRGRLRYFKNQMNGFMNRRYVTIKDVMLISFNRIKKDLGLVNIGIRLSAIRFCIMNIQAFILNFCDYLRGVSIFHTQVKVAIKMTVVLVLTKVVHDILFKNIFVYEGIFLLLGSVSLLSIVLKQLIAWQEADLLKVTLAFRIRCLKGLMRILRQSLNLSWIKTRPRQVFQPIVKLQEDDYSIVRSLWELTRQKALE